MSEGWSRTLTSGPTLSEKSTERAATLSFSTMP
jgi:hypothetical protein